MKPLDMPIDWTPLKKRVSLSEKMRRLIVLDENILAIKIWLWISVLYYMLAILSILILVMILLGVIQPVVTSFSAHLLMYFIVFLFIAFSFSLIRSLSNFTTIDAYEGLILLDYSSLLGESFETVAFSQIYAIQLIKAEYNGFIYVGESSMPTKYFSYEINLVLNNGKRVFFFSERKKTTGIQSANLIAEYIKVSMLTNICIKGVSVNAR